MFFRSNHRKSSNPLLSLLRLLMSLVIIVILGVGLIQAVKAFSGYDPLKLDPESLRKHFTSDSAYNLVISLLTVNPKETLEKNNLLTSESNNEVNPSPKSDSPTLFTFAVMADSHKDSANLSKALNLAREKGAKFSLIMGDLSDVGTVEELAETKAILDNSGLQYYVTPGDHDLWDSRDKGNSPDTNFRQVFGPTYQSFSDNNMRFILIYNSDNYLGLDDLQLKWVEEELERAQTSGSSKRIFVLAPTPLYHPSSDHVMGKVTPKLIGQAEHLITTFKRGGVDLVFSADTHFYSKFTEPKNDLPMLTVGALTSERNPQSPRFAMVDILEDGSYNIEETEVK